jgi:hypothetical protein
MNASMFDQFTCPACGFQHGSGFTGRPSVRACEGSWLARLLGDCPPKERGAHFHVACHVCHADSIVIKKEVAT